jgi:hypothetical protein
MITKGGTTKKRLNSMRGVGMKEDLLLKYRYGAHAAINRILNARIRLVRKGIHTIFTVGRW